MSAISRTQVWYTGAVVGSPTLDPLKGGLFAAAFIVLAGVGWVVFIRTRGAQA